MVIAINRPFSPRNTAMEVGSCSLIRILTEDEGETNYPSRAEGTPTTFVT